MAEHPRLVVRGRELVGEEREKYMAMMDMSGLASELVTRLLTNDKSLTEAERAAAASIVELIKPLAEAQDGQEQK